VSRCGELRRCREAGRREEFRCELQRLKCSLPIYSHLSRAHTQNNCLQPRTDSCALRQLLHGTVPADWRKGAPHRGMLFPKEGGVSQRSLSDQFGH